MSPRASRPRASRLAPLVVGAGLALGLWGCAELEGAPGGVGNLGGAGGDCVGCGGQLTDGAPLDVPQIDGGGSGGEGGREVCGVGECLPDDPEACVDGAEAEPGIDLEAAFGAPPTPQSSALACQVGRSPLGAAERRCVSAGTQTAGEACATSSDCAPGHGCIGDESAGRCRPYCCSKETACDDGAFCAPRPLRGSQSRPMGQLVVPVCVPADNCSLSEAYPCTSGDTGCVCRDGTACTVVRPDGTTSCVVPGEGTAGQACPCAAGHICSQASSHCMRICRLGSATECGSGRCQASANFPDGYGVCIAIESDGGSSG